MCFEFYGTVFRNAEMISAPVFTSTTLGKLSCFLSFLEPHFPHLFIGFIIATC
jgi:hypothetical protein